MFVLHFTSPHATLANVGGKGANLARLAHAGFNVPPGFLVTTDAYRTFVGAHGLAAPITEALAGLGATPDSAALETASAAIRAAFGAQAAPTELAAELAAEIEASWQALGVEAVAVRSSATAEDLPDLSFAGQQDTYLNVVGADEVAKAVVLCFGSLWTARAIGYRMRNGIAHDDVALAVVVQAMVQSEASGVLFTANPLTGHRGETVIDAIRGLGEALVSGQVEPDHFVVETATGLIRSRTQGAKALTIRSLPSGGVLRVDEAQASRQWALDDASVRALVRLGEKVAAEYGGAPQDIEWALLDGQISLLQSRPITSLFPLPPGLPADPPALLFSFGAVQGMQDPMTTLGQDAFRVVSAGFARIWGFDFQPGEVPALHFAAERMWIRFDPLLRNRASRRMWMAVFPLIEAGAREQFLALLNDQRRIPDRAMPQRETLKRLAPVLARILRRLVATLRHPEAMRTEILRRVEQELALLAQGAAQVQTLNERVNFVRTALLEIFPLFLDLVPTLAAGMASFYRLQALAAKASVPSARVLEVMRGLPHNVTTEMDLALWEVARSMRSDADSLDLLLGGDGPALAAQWRERTLPPVAQRLLDQFLARYGVRGVGEIDMGRTRWREDPTQVLQMVQNYLQIEDQTQAPDVVFQRGATAAEVALDEVVATISQRLGPAQAKMARLLGNRARALAGVRETPKFTVIRIMGILRGVLDEGYRQLAAQGVLDAAADGVFLTLRELEAVAAGYAIDWQALVRERKATYAREMRRRQVPRLLLGDGRAFYGGVAGAGGLDAAGALHGTPVSPGSVEGTVHVIFDPHGAKLEPGEILVCPGTDPAWTPLFLSAGGLVMEVGGLMTHGSVVAREYGIPAVVGVPNATETLRTGMRIRVDGSSGLVQVLVGDGAEAANAAQP